MRRKRRRKWRLLRSAGSTDWMSDARMCHPERSAPFCAPLGSSERGICFFQHIQNGPCGATYVHVEMVAVTDARHSSQRAKGRTLRRFSFFLLKTKYLQQKLVVSYIQNLRK